VAVSFYSVSIAPTLEINTLEFLDEQINYEGVRLKDCGGRDGDVDSEDGKVCTFSIQNATEKDSGNYTCWAHNQLTCTEGTLKLDFRGKLRYIHIFRNF